MAKSNTDFRQAFGRMAPQAIISRSELASLLNTTDGAVSQMAYRGELPKKAFPTKRKACWFVLDIRAWLDTISGDPRSNILLENTSNTVKIGRPRLSAGANT
jgi:hypothetical protein